VQSITKCSFSLPSPFARLLFDPASSTMSLCWLVLASGSRTPWGWLWWLALL